MSRRTIHREPESRSSWFSDPRVIYAGLWMLSAALQVAVTPDWLTGSARLVDPPADCLLSDGSGWSCPLSRLAEGYFSECPTILLAFITATFLALIALHLAASAPAWLVVVFLSGSSLAIQPQHLIPTGLIFVMSLLARSKTASIPRILLGGTTLGVLFTIEFGFVALVAAGLWLDTAGARTRPGKAVRDTGSLVLCGALALTLTGTLNAFASTLLRPFSWSWIPGHLVGLQSTGPIVPDGVTGLPPALLLLFLVASWVHIACRCGLPLRPGKSSSLASAPTAGPDDSETPLPVWTVLILSLVGLCCGRYFWMCTCCVAAIDPRQPDRHSRSRAVQFLCAVCLTFALGGGTALLTPESRSPLRSAAMTDLVDPAAWDIQGNVLLMDLDQSSDWQSERMRSRFRLIVDDRWDVFGAQYISYSGVCRDLFEVRADSYLRTDGRYGGYKRVVREWSPVLLVTASSQLDRIRQLSLSPHWTTLSIDGRRTIFGRSDDPQITLQRQRAAETLLAMEWPARPLGNLDSVILAATDNDLRTVAEVLCAIRLPYAALRALPADQVWTTRKIRVWCFLELAHRTRRHSGHASLLDQFRALSLVREIQEAGQWDAAEQLRVARSLEGLEQFDLAMKLCETVSNPSTTVAVTDQQRREARALGKRIQKQTWASSFQTTGDAIPTADSSETPTAAESRLRQALATGLPAEAVEILPELPADKTTLYTFVINPQGLSAAALLDRFERTLSETELSERHPSESHSEVQKRSDSLRPLLSEAAFWLGCLAIESGDTETAIRSFSKSEGLDPHSPFRHLRTLHQQRLR